MKMKKKEFFFTSLHGSFLDPESYISEDFWLQLRTPKQDWPIGRAKIALWKGTVRSGQVRVFNVHIQSKLL